MAGAFLVPLGFSTGRLSPATGDRCHHYDDDMERRINVVLIHFVQQGADVPLVALHGVGVDHREIEAAIDAVVPGSRYRRIYPDLPGMGRSTTGYLDSNNDVVALMADFIDLEAGPVLLLGRSYGAYLARGVAALRPDMVLGLTLLCPIAVRSHNVPDHQAIRQDADAYDELEPGQRAGFDEYFVVRPRPPPAATATMSCPAKHSSTRPG